MKFDAYTYFDSIRQTLKLTRPKSAEELAAGGVEYVLAKITGLKSMEGVIAEFSAPDGYFGIDDTNDGSMMQGESGGYIERRVYVVYILRKFDTRPLNKMDLQQAALQECREIYRSICTKLIKDRTALQNNPEYMVYLHTDKIPYFEFSGYELSGVTGLYMIVTIDHPQNLVYNEADWK